MLFALAALVILVRFISNLASGPNNSPIILEDNFSQFLVHFKIVSFFHRRRSLHIFLSFVKREQGKTTTLAAAADLIINILEGSSATAGIRGEVLFQNYREIHRSFVGSHMICAQNVINVCQLVTMEEVKIVGNDEAVCLPFGQCETFTPVALMT